MATKTEYLLSELRCASLRARLLNPTLMPSAKRRQGIRWLVGALDADAQGLNQITAFESMI
jgi:hypothetical protein